MTIKSIHTQGRTLEIKDQPGRALNFTVYGLSDRRSNTAGISVRRDDLIRELKQMGLTAEDFKEPTFQEQFAELPVDTVFVVTNSPVVQNPEPRFIKVTQDKFYKTGDEQGYHPDPVMSYYGVKVISKPVEN